MSLPARRFVSSLAQCAFRRPTAVLPPQPQLQPPQAPPNLTISISPSPSPSPSPSAITMPSQRTRRASSSAAPSSKGPKNSAHSAPAVPRPSSSVLLLSPHNEVLLLHRVQSSSSFPSAHVFPGGNLDAFHDGAVPEPDAPGRHVDGPAYRLAAVRECFEETGILLARRRDGSGGLVDVERAERDEARRRVHGNEVRFADWLESIGAEADTDGLLPFTRWITPTEVPRRFTTQMYLYMLPISRASSSASSTSSSLAGSSSSPNSASSTSSTSSTSSNTSETLIPTPDGGVEHTAAAFAPPQTFLSRAVSGEIILFPPQFYLLTHLARYLPPPSISERGTSSISTSTSIEDASTRLAMQRAKLLSFLRRVPTADTPGGRAHGTARIAWADKVIGPQQLLVRAADGKIVLGLERPGRELEGSERAGDWERVVLFRQSRAGPVELEVRLREDVLREEAERKDAAAAAAAARDSKL